MLSLVSLDFSSPIVWYEKAFAAVLSEMRLSCTGDSVGWEKVRVLIKSSCLKFIEGCQIFQLEFKSSNIIAKLCITLQLADNVFLCSHNKSPPFWKHLLIKLENLSKICVPSFSWARLFSPPPFCIRGNLYWWGIAGTENFGAETGRGTGINTLTERSVSKTLCSPRQKFLPVK